MRDRSCAIDSVKMQAEIERCIPEADELQRKRFLRYYELLVEWNAKINLTAITDPEGVASRHFADSLLALELIPQGARLIDIGTGAGFPGIPLKIMRPDIELTLLDSLNKRIIFLNEVLKDLDMPAPFIFERRTEQRIRNSEAGSISPLPARSPLFPRLPDGRFPSSKRAEHR